MEKLSSPLRHGLLMVLACLLLAAALPVWSEPEPAKAAEATLISTMAA
ncbi:MAG: hypothetical protein HZT40_04595 [Candidatus Thiothrix singaporensis]|uniref:Uncharacterized protein n=1 Tax=Candidatus Thiothrix singaporensis TaxID=2799669 RepID=A0A7L6APM3_9GAMM|nr:MAG: hypothetical protein HZT40_04595 [Candidatus Thiothrix singaporensis]